MKDTRQCLFRWHREFVLAPFIVHHLELLLDIFDDLLLEERMDVIVRSGVVGIIRTLTSIFGDSSNLVICLLKISSISPILGPFSFTAVSGSDDVTTVDAQPGGGAFSVLAAATRMRENLSSCDRRIYQCSAIPLFGDVRS